LAKGCSPGRASLGESLFLLEGCRGSAHPPPGASREERNFRGSTPARMVPSKPRTLLIKLNEMQYTFTQTSDPQLVYSIQKHDETFSNRKKNSTRLNKNKRKKSIPITLCAGTKNGLASGSVTNSTQIPN